MFGGIKLERFEGLTRLPQKAASAWSVMEGLVGVSYKPLIYLGEQLVNGVNYWFIAEKTTITREPIRRVIKMAIHCNTDGEYKFLHDQITEIA